MSEANQIKPPQENYLFKPFIGSSHSWALSILEKLPNENKILDFGCGSGAIGMRLKELGYQDLYATDINAEVRNHVRSTYIKVEENLEDLNESNFDTVLLLDVIEHMVQPEQFLEKLLKKVSKGGKILISVPNIVHWSTRIPIFFGYFEYTNRGILDRTHYTFFTRKTKNELLRRLPQLRVLSSDVSISPAELVLPENLRDNSSMRAFNTARLFCARNLQGLGAYQLLTLVEKI